MFRHLVVSLLGTTVLFAAQDPVQPSIKEELTVGLRKLEVRVLDSKDQPVKGLGTRDFHLIVDEKPLKIEWMEEVELTEEPPPPEPSQARPAMLPDVVPSEIRRSAIFLLDTSTLSDKAFADAKDQLIQFFAESFNQGDQLKLVQIEDNIIHLTAFTQDREKWVNAIRDMKYKGHTYHQMLQTQREINASLEEFFRRGQKSQVRGSLTPSGFANLEEMHRLNLREDVNNYTKQKRRIKAIHFKTFALNTRVLGKILAPMPGNKSIFLVTGGGYLDAETKGLMDDVTAELNGVNVAVHAFLIKDKRMLMQPSFMGSSGSQYTNLEQRGYLEGPSGNDGDPADTFNPGAGGAGTEPTGGEGDIDSTYLITSTNHDRNTLNTILENTTHMQTGPQNAALKTGGAYHQVSNFAAVRQGLELVYRQSSHFYEIWYTTDNQEPKVQVELKQPQKGWHTTFGKKPIKTIAATKYGEMDDEARILDFFATLQYAPETANKLACTWGYGLYLNQNGSFSFPIHGTLHLDGTPAKEYEVGVALLDEDHNVIELRHKLLSDVEADGSLTFWDVIQGSQIPAFLRCMIRDSANGQTSLKEFVTGGLQIPLQPFIASIAITEPEPFFQRPVFLGKGEKDLEHISLLSWHAFAPNEGAFSPQIQHYFENPQQLNAYFQLQNRMGSHDQYELLATIVKDDRPVPASVQLAHSRDLHESAAVYNLVLDTQALTTGTYTLWIKMVNKQDGSITYARKPFVIRKPLEVPRFFHYSHLKAANTGNQLKVELETSPWVERRHFLDSLILDSYFFQLSETIEKIRIAGPKVWPKSEPALARFLLNLQIRNLNGLVLEERQKEIEFSLGPQRGQLRLRCDGEVTELQILNLANDEAYRKFLNWALQPLVGEPLPMPTEDAFVIEVTYGVPQVLDRRFLNEAHNESEAARQSLVLSLGSTMVHQGEDGLKQSQAAYLDFYRNAVDLLSAAQSMTESNMHNDAIITYGEYFSRVPSDRGAARALADLLLSQGRHEEAHEFIANFQPYFADFREPRPRGLSAFLRRQTETEYLNQQELAMLNKQSDQFKRDPEVLLKILAPSMKEIIAGKTPVRFVLKDNGSRVLRVDFFDNERRIAQFNEAPEAVWLNPLGNGQHRLRIIAYFENRTYQDDLVTYRSVSVDHQEAVRLARLEVVALDKQDRPIAGLDPKLFQVEENGQLRKTEADVLGERPIEIVVLLDNSSSMTGASSHQAQAALHLFMKELGPSERAEIYAYDEKVFRLKTADQEYGAALPSVCTLTPMLGTALHDALLMARGHLTKTEEAVKAIILITDGEDSMSFTTKRELALLMQNSPARVYPILLGSGERQFLAKLAKESGAMTKSLQRDGDLGHVLQEILEELRAIYHVHFYSDSTLKRKPDMKVTGSSPEVKLRWNQVW